MATGDVVFTSDVLDAELVSTEGSLQITRLAGPLISGQQMQVINLRIKGTSVVTSPFDATKEYVVEVKEA
jgi:hypothetical protein